MSKSRVLCIPIGCLDSLRVRIYSKAAISRISYIIDSIFAMLMLKSGILIIEFLFF